MNKISRWVISCVLSSLLVPAIATANSGGEHHKKDKGLPPGLQKKVDQGQPLPPGWQKKLRRGDILHSDIYDRGHIVMPLDRDGRISIRVDDSIIKLDEKTRKILDIVNVITR
ncbi:MAG: hypothetical protein ACRCT7_08905 [Shewanella sp.]